MRYLSRNRGRHGIEHGIAGKERRSNLIWRDLHIFQALSKGFMCKRCIPTQGRLPGSPSQIPMSHICWRLLQNVPGRPERSRAQGAEPALGEGWRAGGRAAPEPGASLPCRDPYGVRAVREGGFGRVSAVPHPQHPSRGACTCPGSAPISAASGLCSCLGEGSTGSDGPGGGEGRGVPRFRPRFSDSVPLGSSGRWRRGRRGGCQGRILLAPFPRPG